MLVSGARGRGFKSHHFDQTVRANVLTVNLIFAGVAELADAPDLGSGVYDVGVRGLSPAPKNSASFMKLSFFYVWFYEAKNTFPQPLYEKRTRFLQPGQVHAPLVVLLEPSVTRGVLSKYPQCPHRTLILINAMFYPPPYYEFICFGNY